MIESPTAESSSPDAAKPASPTISAALSPILRASRFWLVILGTLYTVGLLIVNIDLARYGLISVDLARAEYVMAGALWSFLMVVASAGIDYTTNSVKGFIKNKKNGKAVFFLATDLLVAVIVFVFVVGALSRASALKDIFEVRMAGTFFWIIVAAHLLAAAIRSVSDLLRANIITRRSLFEGRTRSPVYMSVCTLVMLATYAIGVYPQFPREFGGGKRTPVYLVTADASPNMKDLPLPFAGARIGPVLPLFETSTMYMVKPVEESEFFGPKSSKPAVGIDKRFIGALITVPKGETEKGTPLTPDKPESRNELYF